jgi:MFS family permease
MHRDLGASLTTLQWTVNAYLLAFAAGIITAAAIGDRFGRRRTYIVGLTLFAMSSAACALSPNVGMLIVARTVQGIGAAIVTPLSLTLLSAAFPPERRGTVVGIWGGIAGLGVASGPLIGGALTQGASWHWIFWINVPIGLLAALGSRLGSGKAVVRPPLWTCRLWRLSRPDQSAWRGVWCAPTPRDGRAPRSSPA